MGEGAQVVGGQRCGIEFGMINQDDLVVFLAGMRHDVVGHGGQGGQVSIADGLHGEKAITLGKRIFHRVDRSLWPYGIRASRQAIGITGVQIQA